MIDHQIDEEMILRDEVSDKALEAAALVALGGLPTLPQTYCFGCPADPLRSYSAATRVRQSKESLSDTAKAPGMACRRLCLFPIRCRFGANIVWGCRTIKRNDPTKEA